MNSADVQQLLRPVLLKDLRIVARAKGLSPAGGKEQLEDRIREYMLQTGDFNLGLDGSGAPNSYGAPSSAQADAGSLSNNYARPDGQNNGNFISDRPSSKVLAPPGGISQINFGQYDTPAPPPQAGALGAYPGQQSNNGYSGSDLTPSTQVNNYSRPGGQNVGNHITNRSSSRVLAPPGGGSSIVFGDYAPAGAVAPNQQTYGSGGTYISAPPQQQQAPAGYAAAAQPAYNVGQPGSNATAPEGHLQNNYARPGGQNVGNFLTDRPSSKVLAPPGGRSQISFG